MIDLFLDDQAVDHVNRYGEITQRELVRRVIGGDFSYRVTVEAQTEAQSDALRRKFAEWPRLNLRDKEWGFEKGRVVQVDLSYGYDVETWSFVNGYFANEIVYVYPQLDVNGDPVDDGFGFPAYHVHRAESTTSINRFGRWQYLVANPDATAASAAADAANELQLRAGSNPYRSGENATYQELASMTVTALGDLPLAGRFVAHEAFSVRVSNKDPVDEAEQRELDFVLRAIIENDAGLSAGSIAANAEYLEEDHQLGGANVWSRLEALASRQSDGNRYRLRVANGRVQYERVRDDDRVTYLYKRGARRQGAKNFLSPRDWQPGWYVNTITGLKTFEEEITISADATIPQRRNIAIGDSVPAAH